MRTTSRPPAWLPAENFGGIVKVSGVISGEQRAAAAATAAVPACLAKLALWVTAHASVVMGSATHHCCPFLHVFTTAASPVLQRSMQLSSTHGASLLPTARLCGSPASHRQPSCPWRWAGQDRAGLRLGLASRQASGSAAQREGGTSHPRQAGQPASQLLICSCLLRCLPPAPAARHQDRGEDPQQRVQAARAWHQQRLHLREWQQAAGCSTCCVRPPAAAAWPAAALTVL